jgi:hypothetical protein
LERDLRDNQEEHKNSSQGNAGHQQQGDAFPLLGLPSLGPR